MNSRGKSLCLAVLFFVGLLGAFVSICQGASYPSRAIDLINPNAPGGAVDIVLRTIREPLAKAIGVPVMITNRPGGGNVVGTTVAAKAKPDGYTLVGADTASFLCSRFMHPGISYHPIRDFDPIADLVVGHLILVVRSDSEFKTLEDFISYAKENPGKLVAGSAGVGTSLHFGLELLKSAAGINITHLPLGGGGEVIPALLGGHIDCAVSSVSSLKPHIKAGKLRGLMGMSSDRIPSFPEIPTTKDKGLVAANIIQEIGLFAPRGLQPQVYEKLVRASQTSLKSPAIIEQLKYLDYVPGVLTGEPFRKSLEKSLNNYFEIAKKVGFAKVKDIN